MTTMVFAAVFGLIWLGERLSPGEAGGAILIAISGVLIAWLGDRSKNKMAQDIEKVECGKETEGVSG